MDPLPGMRHQKVCSSTLSVFPKLGIPMHDLQKAPSKNALFQSLRERRRAPQQGESSTHVPSVPSRRSLTKPNFLLLANCIQFVLILILFVLYFRASRSPSNTQESGKSSVSLDHHDTLSKEEKRPLPPLHYDVFITIYAYDRPRHLLALLQDIAREADASNIKVGVNVLDDNSYGCVYPPVRGDMYATGISADPTEHLVKVPLGEQDMSCIARDRFAKVEQFLLQRGWSMYIAKKRHARRRYWFLIQLAHQLLHSVLADYFVFLPDDDRLASGFFDKTKELWNSIGDERKMTLMLHVEETRENVPVWTDLKPRSIGGGISRIGWVESGNFMCTEELLRFLNWSFPRIDERRWVNNPPISSGVGATLSELLHKSGKRMYRTQESFVAHMGVTSSKMNAEFRTANTAALETKYFADGDHKYKDMLVELSTVTASVASQWRREAALQLAVQSLAHQVDHLNVYLNGCDSVPPFLKAPYITVVLSQDEVKGDIGDIGKFFWSNKIATDFHFTADDDNIYPPDTIQRLLEFWRGYQPPVVVGVHGIRIKQNELTPPSGRRGNGYYGSREVWLAKEYVEEPIPVHIIGTGTMLYRPADIGEIDIDNVFPEPNMADIWFGLLTQKLKIPMVIMPRAEGWLREIPGTFEGSIYKRYTRSRSADRLQTKAAKSIPSWVLHDAKKT